jgi:glycosyltransferase involved in cell wall biosynthesis
MMINEKLLSVVIPVYNEELTIGDIINRTKAVMQLTSHQNEILVIDDFSHDLSLKTAKQYNIKVYTLKKHLGKGYALRAGFAKARGDIIITIDSDGSHRPEELPEILAPILKNQADLVIGSRYLNHKKVASRKLNAFGVKIFNFLIKVLTGATITDSQSGYRAMKREVLSDLELMSGEYEIESEMLVKTAKEGFRITEVPISFEQRTYGKSGVDPIVDGSKILLSIILAHMKR